MSKKALLIDYGYCTGCKSCELACRNEHAIPEGCWGIRVKEEKAWTLPDGSWHWDYVPVPTSLCDLCAERVSSGELAMCEQTCPARSIQLVDVDALPEALSEFDKKTAIFLP